MSRSAGSFLISWLAVARAKGTTASPQPGQVSAVSGGKAGAAHLLRTNFRIWPRCLIEPDQTAAVVGSPLSSARTSDSRNRLCPPGVRMLLIRPEAAQRVTVFG